MTKFHQGAIHVETTANKTPDFGRTLDFMTKFYQGATHVVTTADKTPDFGKTLNFMTKYSQTFNIILYILIG